MQQAHTPWPGVWVFWEDDRVLTMALSRLQVSCVHSHGSNLPVLLPSVCAHAYTCRHLLPMRSCIPAATYMLPLQTTPPSPSMMVWWCSSAACLAVPQHPTTLVSLVSSQQLSTLCFDKCVCALVTATLLHLLLLWVGCGHGSHTWRFLLACLAHATGRQMARRCLSEPPC